MASAGDIRTVRANTGEETEEFFEDSLISSLVDSLGVNGASAAIWRQKAARFARLVNVSEAGASHSFGDLYRNAIDMARVFDGLVVSGSVSHNSAIVHRITR